MRSLIIKNKNTLLLLGMMFIFSIMNIIFKLTNNVTIIIAYILAFVYTYVFVGIHKRKSVIEKDNTLTILIVLFSYYIISYILGLWIGFSSNIYSNNFIVFIKNALPALIGILTIEIIRHAIIERITPSKTLTFLIVFILILFQNSNLISELIHQDTMGTFYYIKQLGLFLIPSVMTNIYLTYLTSKVSFKSSIIYRLIMEMPLYIIPIIPRFGDYVDSVIRISIPVLLIIVLYKKLRKIDKDEILRVEKIKGTFLFYLVIGAFCFILVYLVSGFFRYQAYVIASGSMTPKIKIGDVVIVDKKPNDKYKVGDVIAYKKDGDVICHRISNIIHTDSESLYETKGDNNKDADMLLVKESQIIGKSITKINYIGYPTVWFNNNKKK